MTDHRRTGPRKANGPGATGPSADTKARNALNVPHWNPSVNRVPDCPGLHASPAEWAVWDAFKRAERHAELERELRGARSRTAIQRLASHCLKKTERRGQRRYTSPGANRFRDRLDRMAFELTTVQGRPGIAYWATVPGTLVGYAKHHASLDRAMQREHLLEESGIDRRYLIEGRFLLDGPEGCERVLDPRDISARDEYAARLYLSMRALGFPRPVGRNAEAAIRRLSALVEGGER